MQPEVVLRIDALDNTKAALSSVKQNLGEVQKSTKGFRDRVESLQPAFRRMAAVGATTFAGLTFGIGKAIQEAGNAEKISQNFENTFGESADTINSFISDFGSKFAFVESEMRDGANSIGFQLNAMGGIGKEAGEEITTSLLTAAGGLSDFFGEQVNVTQAANAMAKGLAGNRQQLIDMGFNVLEEDIKNAAEAMGLNTKELTKSQEAMVFTKLIMEQTQGSVEGLESSMDSYTGQQRALRKATKETTQALGVGFIPMATKILKRIQPVVERIGNWIERNEDLAVKIGIAAVAIAGIVAVIGTLGMVLLPLIAAFKTAAIVIAAVTSPIGLVVAALTAALFIGRKVSQNWERFPLIIKALLFPLKTLYESFRFLGEVMSWVFGKVFSLVGTKMSSTQSKIVDLQGTVDKFTDPLAGQSMMVEDFGGSIKNMGGEATKAADKLKQLREEAAGIFTNIDEQEAESKRELAEAIVEQEDSIADKKEELRRLEREDNSETNAQRIQSLRETIAEEERALRSAKDLRIGLRQEIAEAERRADLTAFERQIEDIQRRRLARLQAQVARLQEIQKEIAAEKMKNNAITRSFVSAQETMQSAVKETREVAVKEAEKMKTAFDSAVRSMSRLRSSTSVSMSTPSIVRNVDDAVISPKGDVVSTNPDDWLIATKEPGELAGSGGNITINISGTFMDDREAARRMGGEIMRNLQQQMRLS